jgi:hypothetical protein
MRGYFFFTAMLICFFLSCHDVQKTEYKLSDEQMAHLMLDLQLAEVSLPDLSPEQRDTIRVLFDQRIEDVYHLSSDDVIKEMEKLQRDQEKLKLILDRVKVMTDSLK